MVVMDPRMSNSAGMADLWIAPWPGTESAIFLAIASRILHDDKVNHEYVKNWYNWAEFMDDKNYLAFLKSKGFLSKLPKSGGVITSYSIHYTKLYECQGLSDNRGTGNEKENI